MGQLLTLCERNSPVHHFDAVGKSTSPFSAVFDIAEHFKMCFQMTPGHSQSHVHYSLYFANVFVLKPFPYQISRFHYGAGYYVMELCRMHNIYSPAYK